jgi:D-alanyl-D-alanine carboxypeptidase
MNLSRAIIGPLLSIVFLVLFVYGISGIQWIFGNSVLNPNNEIFLGSISNGINADNIIPKAAAIPNNNATIATALVIPDTVVAKNTNLIISAKSAVTIESNLQGNEKIIFNQNGDAQLPIASITKLMTAVVVLDNYNLSDTWQVDKIADSQDPMKQDVKLGDSLTLNSFLEIMLVESSNKSAYALSELIGEQNFVDLMNKKAKDIGLQNTFFVDPTGLNSGDVSTANDLAKLTEYILKNYPKISDISQNKNMYVTGFGNIMNTDQLLGEIPDIVCSKTGFTDAANGCLLLAINNPKNSDYLISIVLGADDRFSEMKKLVNWSNAACN